MNMDICDPIRTPVQRHDPDNGQTNTNKILTVQALNLSLSELKIEVYFAYLDTENSYV